MLREQITPRDEAGSAGSTLTPTKPSDASPVHAHRVSPECDIGLRCGPGPRARKDLNAQAGTRSSAVTVDWLYVAVHRASRWPATAHPMLSVEPIIPKSKDTT
jgi:hypothetical protein